MFDQSSQSVLSVENEKKNQELITCFEGSEKLRTDSTDL